MEEEGEGLGGGRHGEACFDTLSPFLPSLILLYREGGEGGNKFFLAT